MCQEMFFMILATAIAACQCLKLLLTGQLRRAILPKGRYRISLSVGELDTQPSNRDADTLP